MAAVQIATRIKKPERPKNTKNREALIPSGVPKRVFFPNGSTVTTRPRARAATHERRKHPPPPRPSASAESGSRLKWVHRARTAVGTILAV